MNDIPDYQRIHDGSRIDCIRESDIDGDIYDDADYKAQLDSTIRATKSALMYLLEARDNWNNHPKNWTSTYKAHCDLTEANTLIYAVDRYLRPR